MTATESKTIDQFIEETGIRFSARPISNNPNMTDMPVGSKHYSCTILLNGSSIRVPFSMGPGLKNAPTCADVLDCLASDAAGYINARSFEEWASEYGYDADSRKAERIYNTIRKQADELAALLGTLAFEELLWQTDRL